MKLAVVTKPTFFIEEDKIITRLFEEELENVSGGIMTEVWLGWAGIILFLGATGMKNR